MFLCHQHVQKHRVEGKFSIYYQMQHVDQNTTENDSLETYRTQIR